MQNISIKKQKQKISFLQKKLKNAIEEKEKAEVAEMRLKEEIDLANLALIRRQLDDYERKKKKHPTLFNDEREALYKIIQSGPSPSSFAAQLELDRILRLITEFSDEDSHEI